MKVLDGQGIAEGNHPDSVWPEMKLLEATIENVSVPCKGPGRGNLIKVCI